MGKKCDLSPHKKGEIQALLENTDLKHHEIASRVKVARSSVSKIKKLLSEGSVKKTRRPGRCGRKRKTTPRLDRRIKAMAEKDPRASCRKLATELGKEGVQLDRKTVNNRLLEVGLKAYRPRKKPRLTEKMKATRYAWAKAHKNWTVDDWEQVMFSDESTIEILQDRVQTVRRRKGDEYREDLIRKTVKHPDKIMVWGAISSHGTSRLYIVEGMMNSAKYINMLERRLLPQIKDWYGDGKCIYQQDSAPCHTAKRVYAWLRQNKIQVLDWPGNSPDMNPIETLWDILKDEIHSEPITTKTKLIEKLIQSWFHSPRILEMTKKLIRGMPKRIQALIEAKGGPTKY